MLKWSLDDLPSAAGQFREPAPSTRYFIEDHQHGGAQALLNRLTEEEREAVYDLVADDVRAEIQQELYGNYGQELEVMRSALVPLGKRLEETVRRELHDIATGAVGLAVAVAERLARRSIETDESYLVRCLEELVGRTQVGASLEVVAHPAEIDRLRSCEAELRDLNVTTLVPDRSLEPGGCIVRSAGQEWDLTFRGQVDALSEMIHDAVTYGGPCVAPAEGVQA